MSKIKEKDTYKDHISLFEFLSSFNEHMPKNFKKVTEGQLLKFKETHPTFFKNKDLWSLDQHRKKIIDWLSRENSKK